MSTTRSRGWVPLRTRITAEQHRQAQQAAGITPQVICHLDEGSLR
jgi:hypothetical protein